MNSPASEFHRFKKRLPNWPRDWRANNNWVRKRVAAHPPGQNQMISLLTELQTMIQCSRRREVRVVGTKRIMGRRGSGPYALPNGRNQSMRDCSAVINVT